MPPELALQAQEAHTLACDAIAEDLAITWETEARDHAESGEAIPWDQLANPTYLRAYVRTLHELAAPTIRRHRVMAQVDWRGPDPEGGNSSWVIDTFGPDPF